MVKDDVTTYLKAEMAEGCQHCIAGIFTALMDPLTQSKLEPYEKSRDKLLQLHVHKPTSVDGHNMPQAIQFLTWVAIDKDTFIPYWTPSAGTLEKAFEYFDETLRREQLRLRRQLRASRAGKRKAKTGADGADGPGAPEAP